MAQTQENHEENRPSGEMLDLTVILHDMFRGFKKFWIFLLVIIVVMAVFGGFRTWRAYIPMYRCEASFTVTTRDSSDENYYYSFYYDRSTATQMAATFPYLLDSDLLTDKIKEDLGVNYINGTIHAGSVANSNLFTMTVTSRSAQDAYDIIQSVVKNYPKVCTYVLGEIQLNMISAPKVSDSPYNRLDWARSAGKYALYGLILSVGLLGLYALTRNTVRKDAELERKLNLPCLGIIPQVTFKKRTGKVDTSLSVLNDKTGYAFQEGFRGLALRAQAFQQERGVSIIGVTCTQKNEGVSMVARNLALALAEGGKRVLLFDANFSADRTKRQDLVGLESFLEGECQLADIMRHDKKGKIWMVSAKKPLSTQELARYNQGLHQLMAGARQVMDFIIVDIPPCARLDQAAPGVELCEGLVYVIRQDAAKLGRIMDGIEDVSRFDAQMLGCVLTFAQHGLSGYGYGYHRYGYGYGRYGYGRYGHYGYGYGEKEQKKT